MTPYYWDDDFSDTSNGRRFQERIAEVLNEQDFVATGNVDEARVVFQRVDERKRPFRRRNHSVYVIGVLFVPSLESSGLELLPEFYPSLIRSLSNILVVVVGEPEDPEFFVTTLERGVYAVLPEPSAPAARYNRLVSRIAPLARSHLIVKNEYISDLPRSLWKGNRDTESLTWGGEILESWDLLPTPFPMDQLLSAEDFSHVRRLFGIGGLSYGNLSVRHDQHSFWMSASGVNKARLRDVGRDILLVKNFDAAQEAMILSVPDSLKPRRVSVDAIEHWKIYEAHPDVGAIIHIHAWMEGVPSTDINYPCGSLELADAVAEQVTQADDAARWVVGLKNHGLTITGRSVEDILDRIDGRVIRQVPMQ